MGREWTHVRRGRASLRTRGTIGTDGSRCVDDAPAVVLCTMYHA